MPDNTPSTPLTPEQGATVTVRICPTCAEKNEALAEGKGQVDFFRRQFGDRYTDARLPGVLDIARRLPCPHVEALQERDAARARIAELEAAVRGLLEYAEHGPCAYTVTDVCDCGYLEVARRAKEALK